MLRRCLERVVLWCFFWTLSSVTARAAVVLNIRAVNPLDQPVAETIRYPLPGGAGPEAVQAFSMKGSLDQGTDKEEEPGEVSNAREEDERVEDSSAEYAQHKEPAGEPSTDAGQDQIESSPSPAYRVVPREEEEGYLLEVDVVFPPKGVITMRIKMKDVWHIDPSRLEMIRDNLPVVPQDNATALSLYKMILEAVEDVRRRQEDNTIERVGVAAHIEAYEKNRTILRQARQDAAMLNALLAEQGDNEEQ